MTTLLTKNIKLFYCYAREDQIFRDQLEKHLSILKHLYHLDTWYDQKINPGEIWEEVIDTHLNTADLILLLISPDFMASEYSFQKEMQRALERHKKNEAVVIPILVRWVHWHGAPFSSLQMLPTDGSPITSWADRDKAFYDVTIGIKKAIQKLLDSNEAHKSVPPPSIPEPEDKVVEGLFVEGAGDFIASIDTASPTGKILIQKLYDWAIALEKEHLVKLFTYHGKRGGLTLLPRLQPIGSGLVSVYNNHGTVYIQFWRSVFERYAPRALVHIETTITPIKQGNTSREVSEELLDALTSAYYEAAKDQ